MIAACSNCEAIQRMCDQRILAEQQRCLTLMEEREALLVDAFVKHMRRTDALVEVMPPKSVLLTDAQRAGYVRGVETMRARRLARTALAFVFALLIPSTAWALGLTVTAGCVAHGVAPTTSGGVALQPADGTLSYKVLVSPIAATGGPVLPPPGSTVILATGTAVPICASLPPGQYAYWWVPTLTPPPPLPGQLPGAPMDGDPSVAVPFVIGTPAPPTKKPDPVTNPTVTP